MPVLALFLLGVHVALLVWALVGMVELVSARVPWPKVSNVAFPPWLLLVHWLAVLGGSGVFVGGYLARWRHTPGALAIAYALMAAVCVIETFGFLTGTRRFVAMALELSAYLGILWLLRNHATFAQRFSG